MAVNSEFGDGIQEAISWDGVKRGVGKAVTVITGVRRKKKDEDAVGSGGPGGPGGGNH